mgnify:CR=1 FL=1
MRQPRLFLGGEGVCRLEKRNAGLGFGIKPPSPGIFLLYLDVIFSDCSRRVGRFRCTRYFARASDEGQGSRGKYTRQRRGRFAPRRQDRLTLHALGTRAILNHSGTRSGRSVIFQPDCYHPSRFAVPSIGPCLSRFCHRSLWHIPAWFLCSCAPSSC